MDRGSCRGSHPILKVNSTLAHSKPPYDFFSSSIECSALHNTLVLTAADVIDDARGVQARFFRLGYNTIVDDEATGLKAVSIGHC